MPLRPPHRGALVIGALLLVAAALQRGIHAGIESGLLALLPCGLWVVARATWRASRDLPADRDQAAGQGLVGAAAVIACLSYPVPGWLVGAVTLGLVIIHARERSSRALAALVAHAGRYPVAWERGCVGGLFALAAVSLYAGLDVYNAFDEGLELVPATLVRAGQVPFRDFYCYRLPGHELGLGAWFGLFGESLQAARWWALTLGLLHLAALYRIGCELMGRRGRLALLAYGVAAVVPYYRTASHWGLTLTLSTWSCAVLTASAWWTPRIRQVFAGLLVGLGIATTWSAGLLAAAAMSAALVVERERSWGQRWRGAATLLGAALLPPALIVGGIIWLGGGASLYRDLVEANASGYVEFNLGVPYLFNGWSRLVPGLSDFAQHADILGLAIGCQVVLLGVALPAAVVLALGEGARALTRGAPLARLAVGGVGVALFVSSFSMPSWGAVSRISPLGIAYLLSLVGSTPRLNRVARTGAAVLFGAGLALAAGDARDGWRTANAGAAVTTRRGDRLVLPSRESAEAFEALERTVDELVAGSERPTALILFHEPGWHFHLDLANWYRAPNYIPGYFLDGPEVADRLAREPPDLVIYSERYVRASYAYGDPRFLRRDPAGFFESPVALAIEAGFEPVARFDALAFGYGKVTLSVPR